ncbi:MAG: efflux RND transporter periplasmic adaptor subunit [Sphingomonas bacterium]|nr:efflux RND transporter periplasmic adaptor subunit [Sphingomonas bacterium]
MTDTEISPASDPAPAAPPATEAAPAGKPQLRRRLLTILAVAVGIAVAVWAVFHFVLATPEEETDDAYVAGDVVQITARDPGTITALHADNTQSVKAGDLLVELDPLTADVALQSAAAELARAVRATRANFSTVDTADAAVMQARAQLSAARNDYQRRRGAAAEGAVSGEELAHAGDALRIAQTNLTAAQSQRTQARSAVAGTDIATNPEVIAAAAAYRRAAITKSHMRIVAPIDGVIGQRTAQVGQQIQAGAPLMAVVPLTRLWVDANFRETQLKDLRIGQPATVVADMYGGDVIYHGKVAGLGAGSGNAFALLPPQNASGNWIKIVQRVPVRIALETKELIANPLRVGLSVAATVDTSDHRGHRIAAVASVPYTGQTSDGSDPAIEARIRQIIAANR